MCNTKCNNESRCHDADFVCCAPLVHCCGGYSEHNNCCPHNRCCNQPCCGDGCCGPMCPCCYKLKKAFDDLSLDVNRDVRELRSQVVRDEVTHADDISRLTDDLGDLAEKENNDVNRLDGEIARLDAKDALQDDELAAERAARIAADNNLNIKIEAETTRAKSKEDQLAAQGFADVEYIFHNNKYWLTFKNKAGDVLDEIDASPFIVDGMVDSVALLPNTQTGNTDLVITFNTDSGKQPIRIDIGDIFEANDFSSHINDNTRHITAAERLKWNAKPNWNASESSDDGILNKPTLGTAASKNVPTSGNASTSQVVMGNDSRLSDARTPVAHTHTVADITNFPTLATVATSGSYNDLTDKPTGAASQYVTYEGNQVTIQAAITDIANRLNTLEGKQYWTRSSGNLTPSTSTDSVTAAGFFDSTVS